MTITEIGLRADLEEARRELAAVTLEGILSLKKRGKTGREMAKRILEERRQNGF